MVGVAGIHSALDLAESGIKVYIVESTPSFGGRWRNLTKHSQQTAARSAFSLQIRKASKHQASQPLRGCRIERECRDFKVKEKCVGCGTCAEKCPVKVPNEFDLNLGMRKAIYIPFPQAVPLKYIIDREHCLFFRGLQGLREVQCIELNVGVIIVATGFDQIDAGKEKQFGYGRYRNVRHS